MTRGTGMRVLVWHTVPDGDGYRAEPLREGEVVVTGDPAERLPQERRMVLVRWLWGDRAGTSEWIRHADAVRWRWR